jgi:RNA polymerase sigma factor (sigma-70 family)
MTEAVAPSRESVRGRKLLRAARRGDSGARDRLVAGRLDMVRSMALRYRNLGLSLDDLVQEGCIGLLEAIDRYDPARHPDFDAFARFRIRRAIRNGLTEQARLIRLPKHVVARRHLLALKEAELAATVGRQPTTAELAAAAGLSEAQVLQAQGAPADPLSLGVPEAREALVADGTTPDPEQEIIAADRTRLVRRAVDGLDERRREVIRRRFGLGEPETETSVAALARDLHVSERRTRTIEHDALHLLARELEGTLGGN